MFILEKESTTLESKTGSWDVPRRKVRFDDFKTAIRFASWIPLFAFVGFYPPIADIAIIDGSVGLLGIMILCGQVLATLCCLGSAFNRPHREQQKEAEKICVQWEREMLFPYLERKYGVRFRDKDLFSWGGHTVTKDGRSFEVAIKGLVVHNDDEYGDLGHHVYRYQITNPEGPWLEEIVRPEKISYKAMEPVN